MEALQIGKIRIHLKGGTSYDCPEANKKSVIACIANIARIEHYKPAQPVPLPKSETSKPEAKTRS